MAGWSSGEQQQGNKPIPSRAAAARAAEAEEVCYGVRTPAPKIFLSSIELVGLSSIIVARPESGRPEGRSQAGLKGPKSGQKARGPMVS